MVKSRRWISPWPAVLALVLFGVWMGLALFHVHADEASCPICKELQTCQAVLVHHAESPRPADLREPLAHDAPATHHCQVIPLPTGRAPPTA